MSQSEIKKVKLSVDKNIGNRVKIRANRGRHKIDISEGVIRETYPSIFLVEIDNEVDDTTQKISFSYTDVLTKDVQMQLIWFPCKNHKHEGIFLKAERDVVLLDNIPFCLLSIHPFSTPSVLRRICLAFGISHS